MVKTAVVFFSHEGNTKYAAEYISAITGADLIELEPKEPYPSGKVSKYLAGKDALAHKMPELKDYEFNKDNYDKIVIGTPVWAGNPAPPINTFLAANNLSGKELAFFTCSAGGNGDKCIDNMMKTAGADPDSLTLNLIDPMKKRDPAKLQEMEHWCLKLLGSYETDELWDLYDADRNPTGETMNRGAEIPEGRYHIVVSVWIRNSEGKYLMSRRSMKKGWCPGAWETTGGAVDAGEDSLTGGVREVKEELGIDLDPSTGKLVRSVRSDGLQDFYDVWMFEKDVDISDIIMQEEEVSDVAWMTREEIDRLWQEHKLHILLKYYKEII